jgi:NAD(P)H-dependent FMN reductase
VNPFKISAGERHEDHRNSGLYDGDIEAAQGIPARAAELKERIAAADGLLLVTPEYNNSIPGVFKNAIDWLTRPAADIPRVFGGRPVGLIGAAGKLADEVIRTRLRDYVRGFVEFAGND